MATNTQIVNGVDVNQLVATIDAVKENPELAQFRFRSKSRWEGGARSTTTFDSFYGVGSERQQACTQTLAGDEPAVLLGGDTAPNAVETVLAGLASCLAVGNAYNAAAQGIELDEVAFQLEGDLDLHAFLGLSDRTRPGYEAIRVKRQVKSPASREQLEGLRDHVQRTSPVLDIIANRVPVMVDIVDARH